MTDTDRATNRKAIDQLHPGNRFRLMAGLPLLPETNMKIDQINELKEARELLRSIRDNEVNAQDEADKFMRDHHFSELKNTKANLSTCTETTEAQTLTILRLEKERDEWRDVARTMRGALEKSIELVSGEYCSHAGSECSSDEPRCYCQPMYQALAAFDKLNNQSTKE